MPIGDFDYKILSHVAKAEQTTMTTLCKKFGTQARPSVASLHRQGYLSWQPSASSAFTHDDTGAITITQKGTVELNNDSEHARLCRRAVIKERIIGALYTLFLETCIYGIHCILDKFIG